MNEVPINAMLNNLTVESVWVVLKLMYLVAMGLYGIFAVVVVRQVQLMIEALNGNLDLPLKLIAWVHLGIAVVMILMAIVIL